MIKSTITEAVKTDLDTRTAKGIKEYGRPLSKYMGEDGLKHAYEEALDLAQYLKLRLMEEATPYQCYWKDRALAAEKKLAKPMLSSSSLPFSAEDLIGGPLSGFFVNHVIDSVKKAEAEHEARKKLHEEQRQQCAAHDAEFERLKKKHAENAGVREPVKCRHCGWFPTITSIQYAGWNWQLHCSSRVELCRTSSGRTLDEAVTYWNKCHA